MTAKQIAAFGGILEAKRAELTGALTGRDVIAINSTADMFDQIQLATERDLAIGYLERESTRLREIENALRRIQAGTFGICIDCEEEINIKRLNAIPWTHSCIACREAADRDQTFNQPEMQSELLAAD